MTVWNQLRSWLKATVRHSRMEDEMDAELRFHIESYADDLVRSGMARQEAMRRARLESTSRRTSIHTRRRARA